MNARSIALSVGILSAVALSLGAGCGASAGDGPSGSSQTDLQKCGSPIGCGEYNTWGVPYQFYDCEQGACCVQGGGWPTDDPTVQTFLNTLQANGCHEPQAYARNGATNWYLYAFCPSAAYAAVNAAVKADATVAPLDSWDDVESPSVCIPNPTGGFYAFYDPGCPNCKVSIPK